MLGHADFSFRSVAAPCYVLTRLLADIFTSSTFFTEAVKASISRKSAQDTQGNHPVDCKGDLVPLFEDT